MAEQRPTLDDLIPKGVFVGTSLILHYKGRFLYGIRAPKTQSGPCVLELTGIGGGIVVGSALPDVDAILSLYAPAAAAPSGAWR